MAVYVFRWGDDVQPYILQLASQHIETLSDYCHDIIQKILDCRDLNKTCVVGLMPHLAPRRVLKGKAVHRFERLGFHFALRERPMLKASAKPEFVLNFTTMPDFPPEDMPPRLRRVDGKPLSARPRKARGTQAMAAAIIRMPCREAGERGRLIITISYDLPAVSLWISETIAAWRSCLESKLYKMYERHLRLWRNVKAMWRRRPQLRLPFEGGKFFTAFDEVQTNLPTRAQLEPQLTGESIRFMLFSFVSREPELWDAELFGRVSSEGERIPA